MTCVYLSIKQATCGEISFKSIACFRIQKRVYINICKATPSVLCVPAKKHLESLQDTFR